MSDVVKEISQKFSISHLPIPEPVSQNHDESPCSVHIEDVFNELPPPPSISSSEEFQLGYEEDLPNPPEDFNNLDFLNSPEDVHQEDLPCPPTDL